MPPDSSDPPPEPSRIGVDPSVPALEERLGCPLPDAAVALAALTHKSFVNENRSRALSDNERLEFLGDAVIDLAVAHRLMERFPEAREGDLSKLRAAVVDEAGLAKMAREIGIGPLLRLGRGEELTGGREKASLLADAMEAVVAAVYLSGGLEPVLKLIDRFLGDAFARAAAGTLDRDFKTQFQELAQSRLRATPRYRVVAEHGPDHSKTFEVELELRGEVVGRGIGRSKKDAEQAAAKGALETVNGRFGVEPRTLQLSPAPAATPLPESAPDPESAPVPGSEPVPGSTPPVELVQTVERIETDTVDVAEVVHGSSPDAQPRSVPGSAPAPGDVQRAGPVVKRRRVTTRRRTTATSTGASPRKPKKVVKRAKTALAAVKGKTRKR